MTIYNNVYSTVDHGRTHIAFNERYQGSIDSYNNFFTKFFANLFGLSVDVTIGSKTRRLNKKSYIEFLSSHGTPGVTTKSIHSYTHLDPASTPYPRIDRGFMRQHLSASKVDTLSRKVIHSLRAGDQNRASSFLGKGADPNALFWVRGNDGQTMFHCSFQEGLPHQTIPAFTAVQYSPLLYARATGQRAAASRLQQYGADGTQRGQIFNFQRTILNAGIKTTFQPTVQLHVRGGHHPRPRHCASHIVPRIGMTAETKQEVLLEDTSWKVADTFLDVYGNYLSTPVPVIPHVYRWKESKPVLISRVF